MIFGVRLEKNAKVPRTSAIVPIMDDALYCAIMTNQKDENYQLSISNKDNEAGILGYGTSRAVKRAYTIEETREGLELKPIARSTLYLNELDQLIGAVREMRLLQNFTDDDFDYICHKKLGLPFLHKETLCMYQFDPIGDCALSELLDLNSPIAKSLLSYDEISEIEKYWAGSTQRMPKVLSEIILDIAKGLEIMHAKGVVHQDLKADNILIFKDKSTGKLSAKITDLGIASMIGEGYVRSTFDIASPQMFAANQDKDSPWHRFFFRRREKTSYGEILYKDHKDQLITASNKPEPANDMFAFGVVVTKIVTGKELLVPNGNEQQINDIVELAQTKLAILDQLLCYESDKRLIARDIVSVFDDLNHTSRI